MRKQPVSTALPVHRYLQRRNRRRMIASVDRVLPLSDDSIEIIPRTRPLGTRPD